MLLDQIGDGAASKVLRATIKAALAGDVSAQSLLLARLWPVGKGRPVVLPLADVSAPDGLVSASAAVIAAMAEGVVSPEEAASLSAVLAQHRQVIELADIAARLERLEQQMGDET